MPLAALVSQAMTELHGEWRTGKTQICHTLAISAQLAREGGSYSGGGASCISTPRARSAPSAW